jgi:hypothetical protein
MPQGYSLLAPVRPESMHIFYGTSAVTAIVTKEAIRLVIQIPLKTDRFTYYVYEPIPIPTIEDVRKICPNLCGRRETIRCLCRWE